VIQRQPVSYQIVMKVPSNLLTAALSGIAVILASNLIAGVDAQDSDWDQPPFFATGSQSPDRAHGRLSLGNYHKLNGVVDEQHKGHTPGSHQVNPFLSAYRKQCECSSPDPLSVLPTHHSLPLIPPTVSDTALDSFQALYNRFLEVAYDQGEPSSFTVTTDPAFGLLAYALEPDHRDHIKIRRIQQGDQESIVSKTVYSPPAKRMNGDGGVGKVVSFAGWEVFWRGIEFEIWHASVGRQRRRQYLETGMSLNMPFHLLSTLTHTKVLSTSTTSSGRPPRTISHSPCQPRHLLA
jgi:hypothetical protein